MRLIDADNIYNVGDFVILNENGDAYVSLADICKIIDIQPTTYDIDKVVEQLKQNTHNMEICEEQFDMNRPYFKDVPYKMIKLEDAIEIVKAGGTAE